MSAEFDNYSDRELAIAIYEFYTTSKLNQLLKGGQTWLSRAVAELDRRINRS